MMNQQRPNPGWPREVWRSVASITASVGTLLVMTATLHARTITLTADDCDEMAAISSLAPRLGWVMGQPSPGAFSTQPTLYWDSKISLLMRFPIKDLVPKGQRITKAELTIAPHYVSGVSEIRMRRILAEWGTGVCQQYRMTHPQKLEWAQPGARGGATDCASKDSAVFKITKVGELTVDLTEDVELWYTGAVANRGWLFMCEPVGGIAYYPSPYSPQFGDGGKQWKLQITFEPQ